MIGLSWRARGVSNTVEPPSMHLPETQTCEVCGSVGRQGCRWGQAGCRGWATMDQLHLGSSSECTAPGRTPCVLGTSAPQSQAINNSYL